VVNRIKLWRFLTGNERFDVELLAEPDRKQTRGSQRVKNSGGTKQPWQPSLCHQHQTISPCACRACCRQITCLTTGKYRLRFVPAAQVPHGSDSGVRFEETAKTLLCSDLFVHFGAVEPLSQADTVGRAREALEDMERSSFAYSTPYNARTGQVLHKLADLNPKLLATCTAPVSTVTAPRLS